MVFTFIRSRLDSPGNDQNHEDIGNRNFTGLGGLCPGSIATTGSRLSAVQLRLLARGVSDSSLAFLKESGQARLTEATLTLTGDWGGYGFRIDGGAGDFYKVAMASDSWKGPNQYISQAYVFGKPFGDLPIRVDAGSSFPAWVRKFRRAARTSTFPDLCSLFMAVRCTMSAFKLVDLLPAQSQQARSC